MKFIYKFNSTVHLFHIEEDIVSSFLIYFIYRFYSRISLVLLAMAKSISLESSVHCSRCHSKKCQKRKPVAREDTQTDTRLMTPPDGSTLNPTIPSVPLIYRVLY